MEGFLLESKLRTNMMKISYKHDSLAEEALDAKDVLWHVHILQAYAKKLT